MAVHKRSYKAYAGALTPRWSRFSIVTRYANKNVFSSKLLAAIFVCSFFYPFGCAVAIYLNHNLRVLELLKIRSAFDVDGAFFFHFLNAQGVMAFILTALLGPGLVSPDLANNALPLYFYRPFSRAEYVVGKMAVLVGLLSVITWVPGLILFGIQASLAGASWAWSNLWMASGILQGSLLNILVLCLLAMALSAWIKRKVAAGAALLGVFFVSAAFAQAVNAVLQTQHGSLLNLGELLSSVNMGLFKVPSRPPVPPDVAWLALLAVATFCLLLLERKVRAYEVVKG